MPPNLQLSGQTLIKLDSHTRKSKKLIVINNVRLWHQLTDALLAYSYEKVFDDGTDLIELYNALVKDIVTRVNPLKYALITVNTSRQFTDLEEAIRFLDAAKGRLAGK